MTQKCTFFENVGALGILRFLRVSDSLFSDSLQGRSIWTANRWILGFTESLENGGSPESEDRGFTAEICVGKSQ
jgi:hypothetical protein